MQWCRLVGSIVKQRFYFCGKFYNTVSEMFYTHAHVVFGGSLKSEPCRSWFNSVLVCSQLIIIIIDSAESALYTLLTYTYISDINSF